MHQVFISYHHKNDQSWKERLLDINDTHKIFIDQSVDTGDIDDTLPDQTIRTKIRDEYLRDTTVTIVLVGIETWGRKHIDWEIYSSMIDGPVNKKSGVVAIQLPQACGDWGLASHDGEKEHVWPDITNWSSLAGRKDLESKADRLPKRIADNVLADGAKVSVVGWERIEADPEKLRFMIDAAYRDRTSCNYDLSERMRRKSAPLLETP